MTSAIPAALLRRDAQSRAKLVTALDPYARLALNRDFTVWAHAGQLAPERDDWRAWVMMAGRGFGKTRAGAEWVMGLVRASSEPSGPQTRAAPSPRSRKARVALPREGGGLEAVRVALVAASLDEARRVLVEGPSGILAVARPGEVVEWSFQRRRLVFASGAEATLFSGAHPDGLRGPEHDFAWCDELAKWRHPQETWDNLQLGLRRGSRPRALVTTTPKRVKALRRLLGEPDVARTGGASGENPHLPEGWVAAQEGRLTALLARQELGGELLEEVSGALWTRSLIEASRAVLRDAAFDFAQSAPQDERREEDVPYLKRVPTLPPVPDGGFFTRIVIGVDPPASAMGDDCGIVVCGLGADGVAYVLADASAGGLSPEGWARKVAAAAEAWGAGLIVAEANNGGEMIRSVLRGADASLPVKLVHARKGKVERAAVAAALFESGKAKFAGVFPALEDQLCGLSYDQPFAGPGRSPDRADAMVWALDALCPGAAGPQVRGL